MFRRFFTFMTITIVICIVVASFSLMLFLVDFWRNDTLTVLSDDALSLARSVLNICEANYNTDVFSPPAQSLIEAYSSIASYSDVQYVIAADDGHVLYYREPELEGSALKESEAKQLLKITDTTRIDQALLNEAFVAYPLTYTAQTTVSFHENDVFVAVVAVLTSDNHLYYVMAVQDLSVAYLPYTTTFLRMFFRAGLLGVLVAFISSFLASYRMVSPLKKLTAVTKQYAEGDFSERISAADTYSELAEFTESFNSMADSLERIEASRSDFVSNTSHELKTPMTIISGFIDGILDGTIPPEDAEKYLRIVSAETKRLSQLVVAMLNVSRIEAGKLAASFAPVHLAPLICSVGFDFERSVNEKKISVEGLDTLSDVVVSADETLVRQIIFNLFDNAVKFTPEGGVISLRLFAEKQKAVFRIRNTGRGIPEAEFEHIFDRFYKVDKSRGLDSKSFGLGLYIVKSIIDLHHGTITVNSRENEYTEFVVSLPMEQTPREHGAG